MAEPSSGAGTSLAVLLRAWRERALLTQAQLAARAGLGVRTIRRLESGELRRPRTESVRLLADALDLTATERTQLASAASESAHPPPPRQLPAPSSMFTGRAAELTALERIGESATVMLATIDGMAGVGKTALAVHAAHRLAPRFSDGQLFLDLHGHTAGLAPVAPADAADRMLRALGLPGPQVPPELDERAAMLRSVLAGRRVLIVLDNATTEAQVRPLLPGTAGCLVLVTSRRRLTGLDAAVNISLDLLPAADAQALFARTSGTGQPSNDVAEIVELCGRLPLAIRIAAARLQSHPTWTPAHLAARLRDHRNRLAELDSDDRSVTAAIDLSYHALTPDQRRCYRLLGLHPGPDLDRHAAAALTGATTAQAARLLDDLTCAHLLTEHTPGRYHMHDIIHAHATHTATRDEPRPDQQTAIVRLLDHYTRTAAVAVQHLYPHEADRRPHPPSAAVAHVADPAAAARWLDTELRNLLVTAEQASTHGRPEHTVALSAILYRHLRARGHTEAAQRLHEHALDTARAVSDPTGELNALINLGDTLALRGEHRLAEDHLQQALALARATGHRTSEAAALLSLGALAYYQARHDVAIDRLEQVLRIAHVTGQHHIELRALGNLANVHRLHGRIQTATTCYRKALTIARAIGDQDDEAKLLVGLGHMYRLRDRPDQAGQMYEQALTVARAIGNREAELHALWGVGTVHRTLSRHQAAISCFEQVLDLARHTGNRNSEFEAWHALGHTYRAAGRTEQAITHHKRAHELARELRQPDDQARAHDGIAHAHRALGHNDTAREHWRTALTILTNLGLTTIEETDTDDIRANLAQLDRPHEPATPG